MATILYVVSLINLWHLWAKPDITFIDEVQGIDLKGQEFNE